MTLSILDNMLWAAGLLGHVALLFVLIIKRRSHDFPVLVSFVAFEVARTVLLFLVLRHGTRHGYFLAYWITGFADYAFQVALIFEIARDVLRPTGTWLRDAARSFLGWGAAGLVAAATLALQIGPPQSKGFDLWDTRITIFTSVLTCALFLAMSMAVNNLGLQWRSRVVALGQGLFVWAFVALLEEFAHAALGWNRDFVVLAHIRMFVYLAVLIYWVVAFWLPEKVRAPLSPEMMSYLVALHKRVAYDIERVDRPPL
jgi:hypothetical protein